MKCPFLLQEYLIQHIQETLKCDSNPESTGPTEGKTNAFTVAGAKGWAQLKTACQTNAYGASCVWPSEERVKGRRSLSEVWVRSPLKGLQQAAAGSGSLGSGIEDSGKPKERIQKLQLQRKRRWAALKEKGRCEEESSKRLAESHRWCLVYLNSTKTSQVSI